MTPTEIGAWVAAVALPILTLLGKLAFDWWKAAQKTKAQVTAGTQKSSLKELDYLFDQYRATVEELKEAIKSSRTEVESMRKEYQKCREDNTELRVRQEYLEKEVKVLQVELQRMNNGRL